MESTKANTQAAMASRTISTCAFVGAGVMVGLNLLFGLQAGFPGGAIGGALGGGIGSIVGIGINKVRARRTRANKPPPDETLVECPKCHGSGIDWLEDGKQVPCPRCDGEGKVISRVGERKTPASLFVSIAIFLVAAFGGWYGMSRFWPNERAAITLADIEKELATNDAGRFMTVLKASFPDDYKGLLDKMLAAENSGAGNDKIRSMIISAAAAVRRSHAGNVASADLAKLDPMIDTQVVIMLALQKRKPALCAVFFLKGPDEEMAALNDPEVDAAVLTGAFATFDAIANGVGKPKADPIGWGDSVALLKGLADAGVSAAEWGALQQGRLAERASSERVCEIGLKFVAAIKALPAEPRRRLLATVLSTAAAL